MTVSLELLLGLLSLSAATSTASSGTAAAETASDTVTAASADLERALRGRAASDFFTANWAHNLLVYF